LNVTTKNANSTVYANQSVNAEKQLSRKIATTQILKPFHSVRSRGTSCDLLWISVPHWPIYDTDDLLLPVLAEEFHFYIYVSFLNFEFCFAISSLYYF